MFLLQRAADGDIAERPPDLKARALRNLNANDECLFQTGSRWVLAATSAVCEVSVRPAFCQVVANSMDQEVSSGASEFIDNDCA